MQKVNSLKFSCVYVCNDKLIKHKTICRDLQGYKQKGAYIATQGPLKSTVPEFWRMIHEFQCGCIVMLCELEEDGQVWADVNISWLYSPVKKNRLANIHLRSYEIY